MRGLAPAPSPLAGEGPGCAAGSCRKPRRISGAPVFHGGAVVELPLQRHPVAGAVVEVVDLGLAADLPVAGADLGAGHLQELAFLLVEQRLAEDALVPVAERQGVG